MTEQNRSTIAARISISCQIGRLNVGGDVGCRAFSSRQAIASMAARATHHGLVQAVKTAQRQGYSPMRHRYVNRLNDSGDAVIFRSYGPSQYSVTELQEFLTSIT